MARITKAALYKWAAGKSSLSVNRIFCSHGIFKTTADSHFLRPTSSAPTMGQGTHCNALHQPHHHIHITSTTKQKQESSHRANLFHFIEVQCTPYPPPKPTSSMYNCTYLKWAMSRALLMCLMQRNSYISADKTCVMVKHAFVGAQNSMLWIQCMFRRKKSFLRRSNHQSILVYITNLTNAYIARCIQAWGV